MTVTICRCEDITEEEIVEAIEDGYTELESLKRHLRLAMGQCQGKTCIPLTERILARKLGKGPDDMDEPTARPPSRQVSFGVLAGDEDDR